MSKQELTLTYPVRPGEICLGYKKRGFGAEFWNGFGGKIEAGETVRSGAVRELAEEAGLIAAEAALQKVAEIEFHFKTGRHLFVHAYFVSEWNGELQESEEMRPQWFPYEAVPYEAMWADDPHWLPRALQGERLRGSVTFKENETDIEAMRWQEVSTF